MHIFYSHSISGVHQPNERTAKELIGYLHRLGHIISSEEFYTQDNTLLTDKEIFAKDQAMIQSSDLILANVTNASLGVGYELGYAQGLGKPIICFYQAICIDTPSPMITGNPGFPTYPIARIESLGAYIQAVQGNI